MEDRFALLIDADNVSAKYIKPILDELSKYGNVTYKRIYGDWTKTNNASWKEELLQNSITPIQQFSYTHGKNATDSAMIIDAMDMLYTSELEGFCLVSSDSDFTKLASRLRESGKTVIGMGEGKTPSPFRKACDIFTELERLTNSKIVSSIFSSLLILLIGLIIMKIAVHFLRKALKASKLDGALHIFILNTAKVLLWILLTVTILSHLGVSTTAFLTVLGACGAAVALALKDSLSNFAGGILIIVNKPFVKGDYIESCGIGGKVDKIDLLYSTLVTLDNKVISIPNGKLSSDVVVNFSRADRRRVDSRFNIGYSDNIKLAKDVIEEIIRKSKLFFDDPAPTIGVASHRENAVEIEVLAWCRTEDYYTAKYHLQEEVKLKFDEYGIEIPYPQMVIHFDRQREEKAPDAEKDDEA